MNLFKGLLFLHGHFTTSEFVEDSKPEYGAATADREFAPKLGNRAASARWYDRFGVTPITECIPSQDGCR